MIKIAHIADAHLDAPHTALKDEKKAAMRRREGIETLFKTVDYCISSKIDIVLIAGDLFDMEEGSAFTWKKVLDKMGSASKIRFFIAPGNHDPITDDTFYSLFHIPENVIVFGNEMESVDLPELNTTVYGIGFNDKYQDKSLLDEFNIQNPDRINLLVIHGEIVSEGGTSRYNPITPAMIKNSGADYIALGHIHTYSGIKREGSSYYSYPGSLEGRGFDETGDKGFVCGTVDKNYCDLRFIHAAARRYKNIYVDVNSTGIKAEDICTEVMEQVLSSDDLYKVILRGMVQPQEGMPLIAVEEKLSRVLFYVTVADESIPLAVPDEQELEKTLTGVFIEQIKGEIAKANDEEKKRLYLTLRYGLSALLYNEVVEE